LWLGSDCLVLKIGFTVKVRVGLAITRLDVMTFVEWLYIVL